MNTKPLEVNNEGSVINLELYNSLDSVFLTLKYDPQEKWVFYQWRGFIRLPDIKEGFQQIIAFLKQQQCSMILGDHSDIVGPWNEGNDWLINEWVPRASDGGLRYWAIHTGDDLFSNISLELFLTQEQDSKYLVKICDDIDEAKTWLQSVNQTEKLEQKNTDSSKEE